MAWPVRAHGAEPVSRFGLSAWQQHVWPIGVACGLRLRTVMVSAEAVEPS